MRKIALVTDENNRLLCDDDRLLAKELVKRKYIVKPVIWNDEKVQWEKYDIVINRSPWNFHYQIDGFYSWLVKLEKLKVNIRNSISVLRENNNKFLYLSELKARGVKIVPFQFVSESSRDNLRDIMERNGWEEAVVKPNFGGSGFGIFKINIKEAKLNQGRFDVLKKSRKGALIQQFVREVAGGEYSFVFLDGKYSHSVRKMPQNGDFRTNYEFSKIMPELYKPGKEEITLAGNILKNRKYRLLYARLDFFQSGDGMVLNELELSDPYLFLGWQDGAAAKFAESIKNYIDNYIY